MVLKFWFTSDSTVSLEEGDSFDVKVTEGQTVAAGDLLVEANLDAIREAGHATSLFGLQKCRCN